MICSMIIKWIIYSSVTGTILACFILIIRALLKDILRAKWLCLMWILLIIRLVFPFGPQSAISLFNLFSSVEVESAYVVETVIHDANSTMHKLGLENTKLYMLSENNKTDYSDLRNKDIIAPAEVNEDISIISVLFLMWIAVFASAGLYTIILSIKLRLSFVKSRRITDRETLSSLDDMKRKMKVKKDIRLIETTLINTPSVCGFIKPHILLPKGITGKLSCEELRFVFAHELAHLKRMDTLINPVMMFLQMLHWLNPLVWCAFRLMREDIEIACDEIALSYIAKSERKRYGKAIINLVEGFCKPAGLPGVVGFMGGKAFIKKRILFINSFRQDVDKYPFLVVLLLFVVCFVGLTNAVHVSDIVYETVNIELISDFIWPVPGTAIINKDYNDRHQGIYITAKPSEQIVAAEKGVIVHVGLNDKFGHNLIIDHGNGITSFYAYCREINVKVGEKIEAGSIIGEVGNTFVDNNLWNKRVPRMCGIYFELRENGIPVDPVMRL